MYTKWIENANSNLINDYKTVCSTSDTQMSDLRKFNIFIITFNSHLHITLIILNYLITYFISFSDYLKVIRSLYTYVSFLEKHPILWATTTHENASKVVPMFALIFNF
jgi:hypothetical protein